MTSLYSETDGFLQALRHRPDVVGVLLVGSKSRGYQDAHSDDDLEVILKEPFETTVP